MTEKQTPNFAELFYYDPTSPSGLRWKVDRFNVAVIVAVAGSPVGSKVYRRSGAPAKWKVHLLGVNYSIHRVILQLHGVSLPGGHVIDHIDGNPFNNVFENLRVVSMKANRRNYKKRVNNSSGVTGVSRRVDRSGRPRWVAQWHGIGGARQHRSFSVSVYGEEGAEALAIKAREDALKALNEAGAGYSERHGT